ncbi:MAG: helix-turn-helix domain-containing protein [Hyphomicrobiales bacterium]|nr:helix-turn-helix domain-containing protein [Hyphomicrobiales bacterium]
MSEDTDKEMLQEVQWVRKLLMLQALASGFKQKQLAGALGVSEATLSRMLPKGFARETKAK